MAEDKSYKLPEASRVAGVSIDELRCSIMDGVLRAETLQGSGQYNIRSQDLMEYVTRSRRDQVADTLRKQRVLIIDDEINFANIMKLELERDPRIEAKFATWGKDGIKLAKSFEPDLCLIDFMLPDTTGDEVLAAIHKQQKGGRRCKTIVYSAHTREAIQDNPNLEARLESLGADEFMSKSGGMRHLTIRVFELLELDTNTKVHRRPIRRS